MMDWHPWDGEKRYKALVTDEKNSLFICPYSNTFPLCTQAEAETKGGANDEWKDSGESTKAEQSSTANESFNDWEGKINFSSMKT